MANLLSRVREDTDLKRININSELSPGKKGFKGTKAYFQSVCPWRNPFFLPTCVPSASSSTSEARRTGTQAKMLQSFPPLYNSWTQRRRLSTESHTAFPEGAATSRHKCHNSKIWHRHQGGGGLVWTSMMATASEQKYWSAGAKELMRRVETGRIMSVCYVTHDGRRSSNCTGCQAAQLHSYVTCVALDAVLPNNQGVDTSTSCKMRATT